MTTNNVSLLLLLSLFACGCEETPPRDADLSTPNSAALVFLVAVQHADARTARSVSIGTWEQKGWVDSLVAMVDGVRKYNEALYAKFGRFVDQTHIDLEEGIRRLVDEPVTLIREGKVSSDGPYMRIDIPPNRGLTSHFQLPVFLRQDKQGWKVDLAKYYADGVPPASLGQVTANFHQMRQVGGVFQGTARDVMAGRFKSEAEANVALRDRLAAVKGQ